MPERSALLGNVAERLIAHRIRHGYDLDDAATIARVDAERLAEAEAGELALDERELAALADGYGVEVTAFFGGLVTPFSYLAGA